MNDSNCNKPLSAGQNVFQVLHDGTSVSKPFYDSVYRQIDKIVHRLNADDVYTAEDLCGDEFWNSLGAGECKMAGKYLVDMVKNGLLPLSFVESKHEYPKKYRLK